MAADWAGTLLVGRYRLGRRVGGGGMGAVHEARDERVGRRVAVKVLHPQLARERQHVARFFREAKASAGLLHPHIVQVLDVSSVEDEGPPFLVMEFLSGQSLARVLKDEKKLAPGRVIRLARQLLSALDAAHGVGIVHRDMKPGNIIVQRGYDGREIAKIVDFGIAKLMDSEGYTRLTATGEVLGTPAFMSPEQLTGGDVDGRADLYGVAAIIYNCIVGEPAVGTGTLAEVAQRALTGDHPPLARRVDVHPGLSEVVERALNVDPNARYVDASDMSRALAPYEDPTDALLVPEHRLPTPATRLSPSMRPMAIPRTSERPPDGPGYPIPTTSERPPGAPTEPHGSAVPVASSPSAAASPAAVVTSARVPPPAAPKTGAAEPTSRQAGLALAALAFVGCLLGAGGVAAYVLFVADRDPVGSPPAAIPVATVPSGGETPLEPMIPSSGVGPVVPSPVADPPAAPVADAEPDVEAEREEEPAPRTRRRRRSRARRAADSTTQGPPPPNDQPLHTISSDQVRQLTRMNDPATVP